MKNLQPIVNVSAALLATTDFALHLTGRLTLGDFPPPITLLLAPGQAELDLREPMREVHA
jgi:hypothetical protein